MRGRLLPSEWTETRFAYAASGRRSRPPERALPWQASCVHPWRWKISVWIAAKVLSNESEQPGSDGFEGSDGDVGSVPGAGSGEPEPPEPPPHAAAASAIAAMLSKTRRAEILSRDMGASRLARRMP